MTRMLTDEEIRRMFRAAEARATRKPDVPNAEGRRVVAAMWAVMAVAIGLILWCFNG